jgi:general secretion pathway protein G
MRRSSGRPSGFTLIELMIVMTIVALLLALVTPRYMHSLYRSKETVLHANLDQTRDAIDKFYGDTGQYPDTLGTLVERHYLRKAPYDPLTDSTETWVLVPSDSGGVSDLHSGAEGNASDGTPYAQW